MAYFCVQLRTVDLYLVLYKIIGNMRRLKGQRRKKERRKREEKGKVTEGRGGGRERDQSFALSSRASSATLASILRSLLRLLFPISELFLRLLKQ
ncbi:hypothetical protein J5N97_018078 [Dioscorea zingiberensis]|uniref:Uncharacterized protein n=1 Tax=Dioscorea zingiberensis TaxID=325984 RepID=A0A9D5HH15_9LILI|nr:hypothetical protein J5N97_018078 [Dioscorea zingiberensis]